jgi:predicted Ser/Thr protein kinase
MIEKLREELIKDILTFLDEGNYKTQDANIQNTVMQIIVDAFDELEWSMNTNGNVELKNK